MIWPFSSTQPLGFAPSRGTAWLLIIIGVLAIVAGVAAVLWPGLTLLTLVYIFGWYALIRGVMEIIHAFTGPQTTEGGIITGLVGLVNIVLGIAAFLIPGITLGAFVLLLAAYLIITGVVQAIAAFRGHVHGWLLFWGVLSIIAGIVALIYPGAGALTIAVIFAVYAILGGISALMSGVHILQNGNRSNRYFGTNAQAS